MCVCVSFEHLWLGLCVYQGRYLFLHKTISWNDLPWVCRQGESLLVYAGQRCTYLLFLTVSIVPNQTLWVGLVFIDIHFVIFFMRIHFVCFLKDMINHKAWKHLFNVSLNIFFLIHSYTHIMHHMWSIWLPLCRDAYLHTCIQMRTHLKFQIWCHFVLPPWMHASQNGQGGMSWRHWGGSCCVNGPHESGPAGEVQHSWLELRSWIGLVDFLVMF